MLTGERFCAKPLEMGDQLLALREQATPGQHAGPDTSLDTLHESGVLPPDLVVEGDQLVDPSLVDAGCEEVVEESRGLLRPRRQDRAAGEVRPAWEDVDAEV